MPFQKKLLEVNSFIQDCVTDMIIFIEIIQKQWFPTFFNV